MSTKNFEFKIYLKLSVPVLVDENGDFDEDALTAVQDGVEEGIYTVVEEDFEGEVTYCEVK